MEKEKCCAMCGLDKPLQNSHIIPRSYFRSLKGKDGQLFVVKADEGNNPKLSNSDPKEKLLCRDCEQFLSDSYEKYGTRLLKDKNKVKRTEQGVVIKDFKFKQFYLYLISILWRASISTIQPYKHIFLSNEINQLLCNQIKNNSLYIQTPFRLDHIIQIYLFKLTDKTGTLDDNVIRKVFADINYEKGENPKDGIVFYFMIDGFLIAYRFAEEQALDWRSNKKYLGQLINCKKILVPINDISDFKQIADGFNCLSSHAVDYDKE